jgi:hypothetical protein
MSKKKPYAAAEEQAVEEAIEEEAAVVKEEKPQEPLMYVGPTIPGVAIQNVVYTDIPEGAKNACKEVPQMRNLFLPVKQYPMAAQMLRERSGFVYVAYCDALNYKGGTKA